MREWINLVEAVENKYLYHVTRQDNIDSIRSEGLNPNVDRDTNFDGYPVLGRLYVSLSEQASIFYSDTFTYDFGDEEAFILRFPKRGYKISVDEYGNPEDRYITQCVPKDDLELKTDKGWVKL
jgi:hypothetical protein